LRRRTRHRAGRRGAGAQHPAARGRPGPGPTPHPCRGGAAAGAGGPACSGRLPRGAGPAPAARGPPRHWRRTDRAGRRTRRGGSARGFAAAWPGCLGVKPGLSQQRGHHGRLVHPLRAGDVRSGDRGRRGRPACNAPPHARGERRGPHQRRRVDQRARPGRQHPRRAGLAQDLPPRPHGTGQGRWLRPVAWQAGLHPAGRPRVKPDGLPPARIAGAAPADGPPSSRAAGALRAPGGARQGAGGLDGVRRRPLLVGWPGALHHTRQGTQSPALHGRVRGLHQGPRGSRDAGRRHSRPRAGAARCAGPPRRASAS